MRIGIIAVLAVSAVSALAQEVPSFATTGKVPVGSEIPVVHSPSFASIGTVTVSEHYVVKKQEYVYTLSTASGFSTEGCDFVTTFSAVQMLESEESHPDGQKQLSVTINGETYLARLHSHGYYPLGLNLACLDLIPNANGPATLFRLGVKNISPSYVETHDNTLARVAGMPLVNASNEVVGIFVDSATVVWGHDINRFLELVVDGSPRSWPELRMR